MTHKQTMWTITKVRNVTIQNPLLIAGLPGIGNVGKIAVDILIEEIRAQKILDFFSHSLPNSVFVNENNLVELPKIEIYHKRLQKKDFLFLAGDVQPTVEEASYAFSETILDYLSGFKQPEILTLGGIGLPELPRHPKVYLTGNTKRALEAYKNLGLTTQIYGVVGPIIGISGLLLGLSKNRNIPAVSMLAETYGHPVYIGLPGARAILSVLNKRFSLKISLTELDNEIKDFERSINSVKTKPLVKKYLKYKETNYIG